MIHDSQLILFFPQSIFIAFYIGVKNIERLPSILTAVIKVPGDENCQGECNSIQVIVIPWSPGIYHESPPNPKAQPNQVWGVVFCDKSIVTVV